MPLFKIQTAVIVKIVPKIVERDIASSRKYQLKKIALKGTKNIKELASWVPSLLIATKYIEVAKVVLKTDMIKKFIQNIISNVKILPL